MKFRMLRLHSTGYPFPWNPNTATVDGMVEVMMDAEEIAEAVKITPKKKTDELPQEDNEQTETPVKEKKERLKKGWKYNKFGKLTRIKEETSEKKDDSTGLSRPEPIQA